MKALMIALGIGVFSVAFSVGFFLALSRAASRPRPKSPATGTLHERMVPRPRTNPDADEWAGDMADTPIFRAAVMREQERLRAELDDDAAVAAWLRGGAR
jgi:hypothetical protein